MFGLPETIGIVGLLYGIYAILLPIFILMIVWRLGDIRDILEEEYNGEQLHEIRKGLPGMEDFHKITSDLKTD